MARRFRVTVDGEAFEVEVEELPAGLASAPAAAAVAATVAAAAPAAPATTTTLAASPAAPLASRPKAEAARVSATQAAPAAAPGGTAVKAPFSGTVIDVRFATGQIVRRGQVGVVIEAMKMQNEIAAPVDGVVQILAVGRGQTVSTNDVLFIIG